MDAQGTWRVASLSPSRRDAYLQFFDHERGAAFADNPAWSGCYCHFFHAATALDWASLPPTVNRSAVASRIEVGEMEGFLACDDSDRVVGWLNAQPRHKVPHCFARLGIAPPPIDVPAHEAAVILCLVVDPAHRRQGVARALLGHALDALAERGIRVVDAFPVSTPSSDDAGQCRGPLALFEQIGFSRIAEHGDQVVMRRALQ